MTEKGSGILQSGPDSSLRLLRAAGLGGTRRGPGIRPTLLVSVGSTPGWFALVVVLVLCFVVFVVVVELVVLVGFVGIIGVVGLGRLIDVRLVPA
jgi:hypothetical protein